MVGDKPRAQLLLACQAEGSAEARPDISSGDAAGPEQPPGRGRITDARKVEVGSRPRRRGSPGRIGIAAADGNGVVAADIEQQVELALHASLVQPAGIAEHEGGVHPGASRVLPGRRDGLRREVHADRLPAPAGQVQDAGSGPAAQIQRPSWYQVPHQCLQLRPRFGAIPPRLAETVREAVEEQVQPHGSLLF